jgi:hypothetical protein
MPTREDVNASVCSIYWAWLDGQLTLAQLIIKLKQVRGIVERAGLFAKEEPK